MAEQSQVGSIRSTSGKRTAPTAPQRTGPRWPASCSAEQAAFADPDRRIEGYALPVAGEGTRHIVVSTQSRGDEAALQAALSVESDYVAFVGSGKKAATLRAKLRDKGVDPARLERLKAPAGLDLGAITPEEIALSILAEIVMVRRKRQRAVAEA